MKQPNYEPIQIASQRVSINNRAGKEVLLEVIGLWTSKETEGSLIVHINNGRGKSLACHTNLDRFFECIEKFVDDNLYEKYVGLKPDQLDFDQAYEQEVTIHKKVKLIPEGFKPKAFSNLVEDKDKKGN